MIIVYNIYSEVFRNNRKIYGFATFQRVSKKVVKDSTISSFDMNKQDGSSPYVKIKTFNKKDLFVYHQFSHLCSYFLQFSIKIISIIC